MENGNVKFLWRSSTSGSTSSATASSLTAPVWVKLVRASGTFSAYYSTDGSSWTQIGTGQSISMGSTYLTGLAVSAGDNGNQNVGRFDHVSLNGTTYSPSQTETDNAHRPMTVVTLDNGGETLTTSSYDGDGLSMVDADADGVADALDSSKLRAENDNHLRRTGPRLPHNHLQGRPRRRHVFHHFHQHGRQRHLVRPPRQTIASHTSGGAMSKMAYDGAGRTTVAYVTDGGAVNNTTSAGTILIDLGGRRQRDQ